jgi:virginiamycin A acetyltransferase
MNSQKETAMTLIGPDPDLLYPVPGQPRIMFAKNIPGLSNVDVGAYTYYDDPAGPDAFKRNILYHFPDLTGDWLRIGRFCAIASGVRFVMNGANHALQGLTTYPFPLFSDGWTTADWSAYGSDDRGDTTIGHDVWLGRECVIMPGINIGNGAIVASFSIVTRDVPPYAIAAGNPARIVKFRFETEIIARLLEIAWWDWPAERLAANLPAIMHGRVDDLR